MKRTASKPAGGWRLALAWIAGVILASCSLSESINHDTYRIYHASRFTAAAKACAGRDFAPVWPSSPPTPLLCEMSIEGGYRQIAAAQRKDDAAWQELLVQAAASVDLIDRLVEALVTRDVPRIKLLAPELASHASQLQAARKTWQAQQAQTQLAVDRLRDAWNALWPAQDLNFDFSQAVATARQTAGGSVKSEELPALRHYYDATYTRLAMTYLGFTPADEPDPEPALPSGAESLGGALKPLEAALRARYDLDQAIELDAAQLDEIAQAGLLPKDWRAQPLDPVKLGEQRAGASLARLKLLKLADTLLTQCLDLHQNEVDWQWRRAWPRIDVETDIRAFAKLQPASGGAAMAQPPASSNPATEPVWRSSTFRE